MIQIQMSLLDAMSIQIGCAYLSDLRFGDGTQRGILAGKLENIYRPQRRICGTGTTPWNISRGTAGQWLTRSRPRPL